MSQSNLTLRMLATGALALFTLSAFAAQPVYTPGKWYIGAGVNFPGNISGSSTAFEHNTDSANYNDKTTKETQAMGFNLVAQKQINKRFSLQFAYSQLGESKVKSVYGYDTSTTHISEDKASSQLVDALGSYSINVFDHIDAYATAGVGYLMVSRKSSETEMLSENSTRVYKSNADDMTPIYGAGMRFTQNKFMADLSYVHFASLPGIAKSSGTSSGIVSLDFKVAL